MSVEAAQRAKESAAKSGIVAGVLLTIVEVIGGLLSGSLGLLSSAVNTIMDTTASVIALFAVREAGKPPDEMHHYGHLKVESFGALIEIGLLYVVCAWLVIMAVAKITSGSAIVEYLWLALVTNFASIGIDLYAYRRMGTATKRQGSEALGAGALHFLNDLLIAIVVIVGLSVYSLGFWYADSVAALGVVALTIYSSVNILKGSTGALMDAAPKGVVERLRASILKVEGVEGCHSLRVRRAGAKYFIDAHVEIRGHLPLSQAHSIAEAIEGEIDKVFPGSDVVIHTEPRVGGGAISRIRDVASEFSEIKGVHEVTVTDIGKGIFVSYHLEMDPEISLERAHETAHELEDKLRSALGKHALIVSHLEPTLKLSVQNGLSLKELKELRAEVILTAEGFPGIRSVHDIDAMSHAGMLCITLHCLVNGSMTLDQAHDITTKLEEKIKFLDQRIGHVIIHSEPEEAAEEDNAQ